MKPRQPNRGRHRPHHGVLDTTFGTAGGAATQVGTRPDAPSAFLLEPNGQFLMGGFEDGGGKHIPGSLLVARFNSDGTPDTTFGTAGAVLVTPTILGPEAFAMLSNGDYLAVGENGDGVGGTVVEFSSMGVLEPTVTERTVTASSPLQGLEEFPTIFEPDGDYVVCNETAILHDLTTHLQVGLFSEAGVQDSAFSSISLAFGSEAKTQGQAIAVQSSRPRVASTTKRRIRITAQSTETRLGGGDRGIRTPETLSHSMEGIRPEWGLFGLERSVRDRHIGGRFILVNFPGLSGRQRVRREIDDELAQTASEFEWHLVSTALDDGVPVSSPASKPRQRFPQLTVRQTPVSSGL